MNEIPKPLLNRLARHVGFGKHLLNVLAHDRRTCPRRTTMKETLLEPRPFHVPHKPAQLPLVLPLGSGVNVVQLHLGITHADTFLRNELRGTLYHHS